MFDDGEPKPAAFFLGGVIGFKDPLDFIRRNARAVIAHRKLHGIITVAGGGDRNISCAIEHLTRILQQVHKHLRQMTALHEQSAESGGQICDGS